MPELTELSPAVLRVLEENHFEPVKLLRYGPRFVCMVVRSGNREGMFKMVLPEVERDLPDYTWTEQDSTRPLERRLLKEALFLRFFSQQVGADAFEPQIMALSQESPVWSLRTYVDVRSMSAWESNFIFSPRFYQQITPAQMVNFFTTLHQISPQLPDNLRQLVKDYVSTLTHTNRFDDTIAAARAHEQFRDRADRLAAAFERHKPAYASGELVITHYEPYSPHIFLTDGKICLIDWENVGWGHPLQDLSVLWMRVFDDPKWQERYTNLIEKQGYFSGHGRLYWESELIIQCFAKLTYIAQYGPLGNPDYDARAIAFFTATIDRILETSEYFRA